MGNNYVSDRNVVLCIDESAPGTYEVPIVALALEKGAGFWEPTYDTDVSDPDSPHKGSKQTTIITDFAEVKIAPKMKMPADHTLITPLLAACGVGATAITGGTSFAYDSTKKTTASMLQISERKSTAVYGARGSFSLSCEVGKAAELSFDFASLLKEITTLGTGDDDNTIPSTPSFEPVFMTKSCTAYLVNGNNAHFKKIDFNLGGDIKAPKDTCSGAAYTMDIKPELQVTMSVTEDNEDAFSDLKTGKEFNFVIPLFNLAGEKKWELLSPKCVVIEQKTPENEGRLDVDRTLECRKILGDDNWELRAYHI